MYPYTITTLICLVIVYGQTPKVLAQQQQYYPLTTLTESIRAVMVR